jgi:hypothetical protein
VCGCRRCIDLFEWRDFLCIFVIATLPVSLSAEDTSAAILHSNGNVQVNHASVPTSSTVYPNDTIEVQSNALARLEIAGTTVDINAETVIQFEGDEIRLDHGKVAVNTSRGFRVHAGCVTATPVNQDWTQYVVTDTDGKVTVASLKDDTYIDSRSSNPQPAKAGKSDRTIVRQSEQKTREEKCAAAYRPSDAVDARGAIMNSPYVIWPATGVIVGGTLCVLLCFDQHPISPSCPADESCK